ncbi:protein DETOXIFICATION 55 [Impatiens glandulifera]|uniref:protein DETOXIFICATION 55 n=1 Tax=Impatiens glandulifera TaxID=253017 RepID=UPI001FB19335|nr:protein DETOXIFICATION 55 [Impatiens glandulifera]
MLAKKTQERPTKEEVLKELKRTADIVYPILAMGLVSYIKNMILVACMGRLGSLELAGGALAIGFTNITGYSVLSGLAMGIEPLCSQAFGSRNLDLLSLTIRRTILLLLIVSLPIGLVWFNLDLILTFFLHQNQEITHIASLYCRFSLPDLISNSFLHPIRIYLRSKGKTWPLMWTTTIATLFHLPITAFLAFTLSLGVRGIAISNLISNFITLFLLISYIIIYNHTDQNHDLPLCQPLIKTNNNRTSSFLAGEEWGKLIQLAMTSCLAVCLEWWWYELIMTLVAGYLENPQIALATSAIIIQTTSIMYTLPSALSTAVSTRVGHELGAGRPEKASLATEVAIGMALVTSTFGFVLTTLGRQVWGRVFTEDSEVLELTVSVLPIIGLCELANCPQTTCGGVLRGTARASVGAAINFYSFYLVGAPVAIFLAFYWKLGFLGLSYGLLAAQVACVISIFIVIYRMEWDRESLKAKYLVGTNNTTALSYEEQTVLICEEGPMFLQEKPNT